MCLNNSMDLLQHKRSFYRVNLQRKLILLEDERGFQDRSAADWAEVYASIRGMAISVFLFKMYAFYWKGGKKEGNLPPAGSLPK